jgi:hypothetical protein
MYPFEYSLGETTSSGLPSQLGSSGTAPRIGVRTKTLDDQPKQVINKKLTKGHNAPSAGPDVARPKNIARTLVNVQECLGCRSVTNARASRQHIDAATGGGTFFDALKTLTPTTLDWRQHS